MRKLKKRFWKLGRRRRKEWWGGAGETCEKDSTSWVRTPPKFVSAVCRQQRYLFAEDVGNVSNKTPPRWSSRGSKKGQEWSMGSFWISRRLKIDQRERESFSRTMEGILKMVIGWGKEEQMCKAKVRNNIRWWWGVVHLYCLLISLFNGCAPFCSLLNKTPSNPHIPNLSC